MNCILHLSPQRVEEKLFFMLTWKNMLTVQQTSTCKNSRELLTKFLWSKQFMYFLRFSINFNKNTVMFTVHSWRKCFFLHYKNTFWNGNMWLWFFRGNESAFFSWFEFWQEIKIKNECILRNYANCQIMKLLRKDRVSILFNIKKQKMPIS